MEREGVGTLRYMIYQHHLVCMLHRKCGMMAADSELTKQLCHMTLLFTQKFYKINSDKFRINSNKLGQMRIKLEQAVSKAS